jgi:multidrug resistance efflux pump
MLLNNFLHMMILFGLSLVSHAEDIPKADIFEEKISAYAVIKPGAMTTMLAINNGIVSQIPAPIGKSVQVGEALIEVMERETIRMYRSGIKGGVAKLHVTAGAAVTPGMPLSTVIDPNLKVLEVSVSPEEAQKIKIGAKVSLMNETTAWGGVDRVSPLVDPDTGAVTVILKARESIKQMIGDVVPVLITLREVPDCKVVDLHRVDEYLVDFKVEAVSGNRACLIKK